MNRLVVVYRATSSLVAYANNSRTHSALQVSQIAESSDYHWKHEPCLYGWKDGAAHYWGSDRKQETVLDFPIANKSIDHPTMKPVSLIEYLLLNNTKSGDTCLDTFGGSGTTLIACEQNNRKALLMEIDPTYVDGTVRRWEKLTGKKAVRQPCQTSL